MANTQVDRVDFNQIGQLILVSAYVFSLFDSREKTKQYLEKIDKNRKIPFLNTASPFQVTSLIFSAFLGNLGMIALTSILALFVWNYLFVGRAMLIGSAFDRAEYNKSSVRVAYSAVYHLNNLALIAYALAITFAFTFYSFTWLQINNANSRSFSAMFEAVYVLNAVLVCGALFTSIFN